MKAKRDGLYLVQLGSLVLLLLGSVLSVKSSVDMIDYRAVYYPAQCMIRGCNPYSEIEVLNLARAEGGERPSDSARGTDNHFARYLYLPTTFSVTVPFALMPWWLSRIVWMAVTGCGLIFAGYLIWTAGAHSSPLVAGGLIGFFLANCELLMVVGNLAGIAIVLCVVAVWSFLRNSYVWIGTLCFAISLLLKPHDTGLVWLYFLLAGGLYRKRALQVLLTAATIGLPSVIWTFQVAPHWMLDLDSNLLFDAVHGGRADPALASSGWHGLSMMVNLQTVFSSFWSDPRFYNAAAYLVCGPLILVWIIATARSGFSPTRAWLALAAIAALTMLPIYHRQYDTKLLLLTLPACATLWGEGGRMGWIAVLVNTAGFVLTGDLSWIGILTLIKGTFKAELSDHILSVAQTYSAPLILLTIAIFYLWVYVQRCRSSLALRPETAS